MSRQYLKLAKITVNVFGVVRHQLRVVPILINVLHWELLGGEGFWLSWFHNCCGFGSSSRNLFQTTQSK